MSRNSKRKFKRFSRRCKAGLRRVGWCLLFVFTLIGVLTTIRIVGGLFLRGPAAESGAETVLEDSSQSVTGLRTGAPEITEELLTPNEYSRAQLPLKEVNALVVHYTANPGTTAEDNRNYFENLSTTHLAKASAHYIIGLEGEIIRCIPEDEMSYASNDRNSDTISIECCHPSEDGRFTGSTYQSLIQLVAWLMGKYDLGIQDVIRHYDVSGKSCPKYYVDNPAEWDQFKADVVTYINTYGSEE